MGNFRKNSKRAGMATKSVDKAQNQLMKQMKKKLDELDDTVETKYNILLRNDEMSSYDGSTALLRANQIIPLEMGATQGTSDFNQRVGDQITFKHIDFKYRVNLNFLEATEVTQSVSTVRVMLFWDSQPSAITTAGATAVNPVYWPQLLQNATLGVTNNIAKTQAILSQKDWDERKRFQIIYDKTHTLSSTESVPSQSRGLGPRSCTGLNSFSKTYAGQKIRFVSGGRQVQNRQLYLAYLSDAGINQGNLTVRRPNIDYNIRLLYDDI
jgi:hypothetical protein